MGNVQVFVLKLRLLVFTEGEGGGTPVCPPAKKEYRDDPFHQVCEPSYMKHVARMGLDSELLRLG